MTTSSDSNGEKQHPVLDAVGEEMEIVPYTRSDRFVTYLILAFVMINLVLLLANFVFSFL